MNDKPRLRSEVPALTREPTLADRRLVTRLPEGLVALLNAILDHNQKRSGPGRAVTVHLALEDETGLPTTLGTYVQPPREWAPLDEAGSVGVG